MRQQRHSLDGFVPRRPGGTERRIGKPSDELPSRFMSVHKDGDAPKDQLAIPGRAELGVARDDITSSLSGIDMNDMPPQKGKRGRKVKKPKSKKRRIIKWTIIVILLAILSLGGFLVYKALHAGGNIFQGSILDIIQNQPLRQDANGRSNILILGTSEDDPGHGGAYLTDSMMVMSIDQNKKIVDMYSIPRDLYVKYGMACNSGYEGKINEYYSCSNTDMTSPSAEQDRLTKTRQFIGNIFGMDIQYAVHVNNTVIKAAVDAVGGVDVDIEGDGSVPAGVQPGSILDRNFDWRCSYKCFYVKYSPGVQHLDGIHALFLAEARGDSAPTYGLAKSNPDREINQQKIIVALKQKAVSTGTFADPTKVSSLLDALGDNLRTNFQTKEIRTLMKLGSDVKPENINRISLDAGDNSLFTDSNYGGASVVVPSAGEFDYSAVQAFLKQKLSSDPVTREGANVEVLNGSGVAGVAQTQASKLTSAGFIVGNVDTAPAGNYDAVEIYQIGDGMTATKAKLESTFGVKTKTSAPPVTVPSGVNFVVIFGKDPSAASSSSTNAG
ncbi:MAG TPA: LCP family protein [Candidatus Chromulinivoraceae bacterium]|nr:LCP family protein [Candidatus Chromulinivoraceae bacterium]